MKDINNTNEWFLIETHITNQTKNKEVIAAMNYLLEIGLNEENLAYNKELTIIDKYDAMVAVWLAINEVALMEEKYEICILIEKAFTKQHNIMVKLVEETQEEEDLWHLEFTKDYYYAIKQSQANKTI